MTINFKNFDALTFDCYGTLIDWEKGMVDAFRRVLGKRGAKISDDDFLEAYARFEASYERGEYMMYSAILDRSFRGVCEFYGIATVDAEARDFAGSIASWPAFDDSPAALGRLSTRFTLNVITNCDTDLFARSSERLGCKFDAVITAEMLGSYKPDRRNFELAFPEIGVPKERILHVAQSLYHDHVPAKELGMTTVWINRRHGKRGHGATPPATAVPDLTVPDMKTFAEIALG